MKKTLSLILTAAMLFSLIPVAAMAEETATDKTVVLVQEDWNYDLTSLADKKLNIFFPKGASPNATAAD